MSEHNGSQPKQTVVEEGTALRGSLASNGQVLVMGRVDGEVSGIAVEITESGAISGRVKTPAPRSRGELEIGEAPQNTYVAPDPPARPRPGGGRRRRTADEEVR